MIGKPALPDFLIAADDRPKLVRVRAFYRLDRAFNRNVAGGRQKKMHMLRHHNEGVQLISAFAAIAIKGFQKETHIDFDNEQFSRVESAKRHEVSSGRRDESSRLQGETSAAGSRASLHPKLARVELVPFPVNFVASIFRFGKAGSRTRRSSFLAAAWSRRKFSGRSGAGFELYADQTGKGTTYSRAD